jgi:hypothetical protein
MRRSGPAGLLLALALLPACASDYALPAEPPEDFQLVVEGRQVLDPLCDFTLTMGVDGKLLYDVHHRGEQPSDRRGAETTTPGSARAVWDALVASGILERPGLPPSEEPVPAGYLVFRLTSDGLVKTVASESGADPAFDAVLQALLAAGPDRLLVPPK